MLRPRTAPPLPNDCHSTLWSRRQRQRVERVSRDTVRRSDGARLERPGSWGARRGTVGMRTDFRTFIQEVDGKAVVVVQGKLTSLRLRRSRLRSSPFLTAAVTSFLTSATSILWMAGGTPFSPRRTVALDEASVILRSPPEQVGRILTILGLDEFVTVEDEE